MPDEPKHEAPKPTDASENVSRGQGSVSDVEQVAHDAQRGETPSVKPIEQPQYAEVSRDVPAPEPPKQPAPEVNVNVNTDKPD